MVDLVKIRRKAKKKEAEEGSAGSAPAGEASAPPAPAAPPPARADAAAAPAGRESKLEKFKQDAGKRRDTGSVATQEETSLAQLELLTFVLAGENYAVDIERIIEIVTPRPVTRIPNADASILGIMSLRGTIVTLVDVRRKLHHVPAGADTPDTRIIVVDLAGEMIGFTVDHVLRVVKTVAGDVEPHPVVHTSELDESVRGVFRAGNALTILLDLDKLLDSRALARTVA